MLLVAYFFTALKYGDVLVIKINVNTRRYNRHRYNINIFNNKNENSKSIIIILVRAEKIAPEAFLQLDTSTFLLHIDFFTVNVLIWLASSAFSSG